MENNGFVRQETCDALHTASDKRFDRTEKDIDKQWEAIESIRKVLQKQAVQIAVIVGGVSAVVQVLSFVIQFVYKP